MTALRTKKKARCLSAYMCGDLECSSPATERNAVTGIGIYLMQKKGDPEPYYIISALTPAVGPKNLVSTK
jgi:hypothetical protein